MLFQSNITHFHIWSCDVRCVCGGGVCVCVCVCVRYELEK